MSATAAADIPYPHIELSESGVPTIAGTTMKVVELVMAQRAHGWSPEELRFQYPHLEMSMIHSALAFYWDHQHELDADIDRRQLLVEEARRQSQPSPVVEKLRALKHGS